MAQRYRIELVPLGLTVTVPASGSLADALFPLGVEFPCGGRGRCKGCRIKVLRGELAPSSEDQRLLSVAEIAAGWRLACCAQIRSDLTLELAQWETTILADDTPFAFTPQTGLGVAVDVGTTTLVAQLLDLHHGTVMGVRTALNAQAQHGADVMSRVEYALQPEGQATLTRLLRDQIRSLIEDLLAGFDGALKHVVLVGNTPMHHLFCGISPAPLAAYPFQPVDDGLKQFTAAELGWHLSGHAPTVWFLPCVGGFVGSDILAGILATRLHESEALMALVDLGTNGEIVVGNAHRLLVASTAAGPAFEGARISMGMRAATGAISQVALADGRLECRVLGHVEPRGVCGSGLVDAVACALDLGWIYPNGRLAERPEVTLANHIRLLPGDIRELQLAKGAIAAGLRLLLETWGATKSDLTRLYLAGAFGNYINRSSARRIGLLDFPPEHIQPAGNTALLGAKLALFGLDQFADKFPVLRRRLEHVALNENERFHEVYVEEMAFPPGPPNDEPANQASNAGLAKPAGSG